MSGTKGTRERRLAALAAALPEGHELRASVLEEIGAEPDPLPVLDAWDRWDVPWEDVSRPLAEAVTRFEELRPEETYVDGTPCAACGGALHQETWALSVHNGRPALVHRLSLWRECFGNPRPAGKGKGS